MIQLKYMNGNLSDRKFVENWVERLKKSWLEKDLITIRDIFSLTEQYYESPFDEPASSSEKIIKLWEEIKVQNIKILDFKILAVERDLEKMTAIIEWIMQLEGNQDTFDGVYEIIFKEKNCIYFKQWTVKSPKLENNG